MGVNDAIIHYPGRLQHGVGLHDEVLDWFAAYRRSHIQPGDPEPMVAHYRLLRETPFNYHPSRGWEIDDLPRGSSSYFAVVIGLALGYERIILAGVPLDAMGHFFCPQDPVDYWDYFGPAWEKAAKTIFQGRVKSLSGRTRELLGEP